MASTQVEAEPPVQEVTPEEATHARACRCGHQEKAAATAVQESKVDIPDEEIGEVVEKEEKPEELFKDVEEKVAAGSPIVGEEKPSVPLYDRKFETEGDDEDEEDTI